MTIFQTNSVQFLRIKLIIGLMMNLIKYYSLSLHSSRRHEIILKDDLIFVLTNSVIFSSRKMAQHSAKIFDASTLFMKHKNFFLLLFFSSSVFDLVFANSLLELRYY